MKKVERKIQEQSFFTNPQIFGKGLIFVPTEAPKYYGVTGPRRNPVVKEVSFKDSAQLLIGLESSILETKFTADFVAGLVKDARVVSVDEQNAALSVIGQKGVYAGGSEDSIQVIIFFTPTKRERSFVEFKSHIQAMACWLTDKLGQKEIWLSLYKGGKPESAWIIYHDGEIIP